MSVFDLMLYWIYEPLINSLTCMIKLCILTGGLISREKLEYFKWQMDDCFLSSKQFKLLTNQSTHFTLFYFVITKADYHCLRCTLHQCMVQIIAKKKCFLVTMYFSISNLFSVRFWIVWITYQRGEEIRGFVIFCC